MTKRTLILITITLAAFVLQGRVLINGQPAKKAAPAPVPETVNITPVEPTPERAPATTRPTFRWSTEPSKAGLTYDFVMREIDPKALERGDANALEAGRVVFGRKGILEMEVAYPESALQPVDKTKFYTWAVVASDSQGNQVGRAITPFGFTPFPFSICWLSVFPPNFSLCQQSSGTSVVNATWSLVTFPGVSGNATCTLAGALPGSTCTVGTCSPWFCTGTVQIPIPSCTTQPGAYSGLLTITRGNCKRTQPINLSIYPSLQAQILDYPIPGTTSITNICWGDDATLKMVDACGNPPPAGCQVTWDYSTDGGNTWNFPPLGQGNPFNTNPITSANPLFSALSCSNQTSLTLLFRGTLDPNCPLPSSGRPPGCPNVQTASLTVTCPTVPGTITVAPGTKICSDQNGDGTPDYPITVNLNLVGSTGSIVNWYVDPPGPPPPSVIGCSGTSCSYTINQPGIWTFSVDVKNGVCPQATASEIVTVEDPIQGTINVTPPNPEVCWGDDKVTMNFVPTNPLPPGATLSWEYQVNCVGPWTASGVTGLTQNSNDLILTPFYSPVNPCPNLPDKVCWHIKAQGKICPANPIGPVTINVIKPFNQNNPPVISPAQPPVKCPGTPVTLTATNYNNCATGPFTFQWYLDGLPISGATSPSFNAVDPGNYTVMVCNKNNCDCIETKYVTVRDCITEVKIKGPCTCKDGQNVTLTASIVSSQVVPPGGLPSNCKGPYTYLWSTGATTPSITIPCPSATTTYWVEVTNAMGCKTKVLYPIKRCQ